jgi:hypothetical protein
MNRVLSELKTLLSTAIGTTLIKSYYQGEVVTPAIPQSYLPALMVFGNSTEVVAKSTAKDQYRYNITIRVVIDLKLYLKEAGTGATISAQQAIINLMEERNTDGTLKDATVLGTLRNNVRGTDYLYNNDITIEYKTIERGEFFYYQADCNLTATTDLLTR